MPSSAEFDQMIKSGELIESTSEMTPEYLRELKHTLVVSGDTELISAPAYYLAAKRAPSINAFMTGIAIIQDELAHAHIAYHILEELGEDQENLIFSRDPKSFRYPYAFDVPLDTWTELVVANGFYDQAGFCLLGDIHDKCSYGPWKRGLTNDQLRQWWLSTVVPYCEQIDVKVPAHKEIRDGKDVWELDYPFPCEFDAEHKRWDFEHPSTWDDVLARWRARGPRNAEMVAMFQEEFHNFRKAHHQES